MIKLLCFEAEEDFSNGFIINNYCIAVICGAIFLYYSVIEQNPYYTQNKLKKQAVIK